MRVLMHLMERFAMLAQNAGLVARSLVMQGRMKPSMSEESTLIDGRSWIVKPAAARAVQ